MQHRTTEFVLQQQEGGLNSGLYHSVLHAEQTECVLSIDKADGINEIKLP